jgi:hypothetical protein
MRKILHHLGGGFFARTGLEKPVLGREPAQHSLFTAVHSGRIRHNRYWVADWLHQQVYLKPHPKELMPRNHV